MLVLWYRTVVLLRRRRGRKEGRKDDFKKKEKERKKGRKDDALLNYTIGMSLYVLHIGKIVLIVYESKEKENPRYYAMLFLCI